MKTFSILRNFSLFKIFQNNTWGAASGSSGPIEYYTAGDVIAVEMSPSVRVLENES